MKYLKIIIILILLACSNLSFAQCPANLGFENGDLSGWFSSVSNNTCTGNPGTGSNCAIPPPANIITPIRTCVSLGANQQVTPCSRIEVVSSSTPIHSCALGLDFSGTDIYSGLSVVAPASCQNNYTLKLGDDVPNDSAESVKTSFVVSSSNSSLIYKFAGVLYNGTHDYCQNPRVEFSVFDLGTLSSPYGAPVKYDCSSYTFPAPSNASNLPSTWHISTRQSTVFYSDWLSVSVNLSKLIGHVIQIQFSTSDCSQGGHWGYAYIDIPCGCTPFHIFTGFCPGQDTAFLQAPAGFSSYQWFNHDTAVTNFFGHDTLVGSGQNIIFPTKGIHHKVPIRLVITPVGGVGCNDTLVDTLRVIPPPTAAFTHQQYICAKSPVQFFDSSYTQGYGQIIYWDWDFGDNTPHVYTQNPTHTYNGTGTYTVVLTVRSSLSCVSDTVLHPITYVNLPAVNISAGNDINICQGGSATLSGTAFAGPYKYAWYSTPFLTTPQNGLPADTIFATSTTANPLSTTAYIYRITDTAHSCVFYDTMNVNIAGATPPVMMVTSKDTICPNASAQLSMIPTPVSCGLTKLFCSGNPTPYQVGSGTTNIVANPTPLSAGYSSGRIQMLITANELKLMGITAGQISALRFNVTNKQSTTPYYNFNIKMGCTALTQFVSTSQFQSNMTIVYSASAPYFAKLGINSFAFPNNYIWDGVSNLLVEFCFSGASSLADYVAQTSTSFTSVIYDYTSASGQAGCTMTSGYANIGKSSNRPSVNLTICSNALNSLNYSWTPITGLTSPTSAITTASPSSTTTYTCVVSDALGCQKTDSLTVVVDKSTAVNLGLDTTICNGGIYLSHPNVSGIQPYTYAWTSSPVGINVNTPNPIFSPSVTTTYTLNFAGKFGCVKTDNVVVNVNPVPTSTFTVDKNPICTGDVATITYTGYAPPGAVAHWNFGPDSTVLSGGLFGSTTVKWSTPGVKNITLYVDFNGSGLTCSSTTTTYQLTVNLSPTSAFTVNPNPICTGTNNIAIITDTSYGTSSFNYSWNFVGATVVSGSGKGPYNVYWNNGGTKNVSLSVTNFACSSTTTIPVNVNQTPLAYFVPTPANVCTGQPINIAVNYPAFDSLFWNWDSGSSLSNGYYPPLNQTLVYSTGGVKTINMYLKSNGCTSQTYSVQVNVTPSPTSSFTVNPNPACSGTPVAITYTGNGSGAAGFTWQVSGNINPVNMVGAGPYNVTWNQQGNAVANEQIKLTVSENGCSTTTTIPIIITPIPTADFTITSPVCAGQNATVKYIGSNSVAGASSTLNWSGGVVNGGSGLGPYSASWSTPGTYIISNTVGQNGCSSSAFSATVVVLPNPIVDAHPDTAICPGSSVSIWATGANSYVWQANGSSMPVTTVSPKNQVNIYTVTGTDNNGCVGTGDVVVSLLNPPFVDAGHDTCILRGDSLRIGSSGYIAPYFHYYWTPNYALVKDSVPQTYASPNNTTVYTLHLFDNRGCYNADSIVVCIDGCSEIIMPSAFSPNGDLKNDNFYISNYRQLIKLNRFDIYNRWGVKVFSTTDINSKGWDGNYNGAIQEFGVYTFFIEAVCQEGNVVRKQGNVTLLR